MRIGLWFIFIVAAILELSLPGVGWDVLGPVLVALLVVGEPKQLIWPSFTASLLLDLSATSRFGLLTFGLILAFALLWFLKDRIPVRHPAVRVILLAPIFELARAGLLLLGGAPLNPDRFLLGLGLALLLALILLKPAEWSWRLHRPAPRFQPLR